MISYAYGALPPTAASEARGLPPRAAQALFLSGGEAADDASALSTRAVAISTTRPLLEAVATNGRSPPACRAAVFFCAAPGAFIPRGAEVTGV